VVPAISEGFRIGCVFCCYLPVFSKHLFRVTEQPYKIPYYAALLRLLHDPAPKAEETEGPSFGKQILEDFWKGFQAFLDKLAWREARLCVSILLCSFASRCNLSPRQIHFFAHLTIAKVISAESLISLLQSFTTVLDEFGVSYGRAKKAALCAAEGLMIVRTPFMLECSIKSHNSNNRVDLF
jgi:nuclear cap-binding protein subunit 1